jgi:hypothetical protein
MTKAQGIVLRMVRSLMAADPVLAAWTGGDVPALVVEGFACEPWASLTFTGHRHELRLGLRGPMAAVEGALDRIEALSEAHAPVTEGLVLIDLVIGETEAELDLEGNMRASVVLEALTIAE